MLPLEREARPREGRPRDIEVARELQEVPRRENLTLDLVLLLLERGVLPRELLPRELAWLPLAVLRRERGVLELEDVLPRE